MSCNNEPWLEGFSAALTANEGPFCTRVPFVLDSAWSQSLRLLLCKDIFSSAHCSTMSLILGFLVRIITCMHWKTCLCTCIVALAIFYVKNNCFIPNLCLYNMLCIMVLWENIVMLFSVCFTKVLRRRFSQELLSGLHSCFHLKRSFIGRNCSVVQCWLLWIETRIWRPCW